LSIFSKLIEKIVKIIWPWIKEHVWPLIQEQIISLFVHLLGWIVQKIKDLFESKSENRAEQAEEKAKSAENMAETSTDENEAHAYRAEAAVWREVAEQYRQDMEEMKKRIKELEDETEESAKNEVGKLNPDLGFESERPSLSIGGSVHQLPKIK